MENPVGDIEVRSQFTQHIDSRTRDSQYATEANLASSVPSSVIIRFAKARRGLKFMVKSAVSRPWGSVLEAFLKESLHANFKCTEAWKAHKKIRKRAGPCSEQKPPD